jgi:hypothetical protein
MGDNPTICQDPKSPQAYKAAEAAVNEDAVKAITRERFGREPSSSDMTVELRLARGKERARREKANGPVVEAINELEEIAQASAEELLVHEEKLERCYERSRELYSKLQLHYLAHEKVATTRDRSKIGRLEAEYTHKALELAAEWDDTARSACNAAGKAARENQSVIEAHKADVQRAMMQRTRLQMEFNREDKAGTTFKAWSKEELRPAEEQSELSKRLAAGK